jgi:hypothetical protein
MNYALPTTEKPRSLQIIEVTTSRGRGGDRDMQHGRAVSKLNVTAPCSLQGSLSPQRKQMALVNL